MTPIAFTRRLFVRARRTVLPDDARKIACRRAVRLFQTVGPT